VVAAAGCEPTVPGVDLAQIREPAAREGAEQVQRRGAGGVHPPQTLRIGGARLQGEGVVVDRVPTVGGQGDAVASLLVARAGLGELARHAPHLHHRHGGPVGQHPAICRMVRILLRMRSAVASANVSAQSPPTSKNASPRAAAATRSRSTSTSPANTSGGAARRSSKTALRSASSGQTGCCTRGYPRHALRAARPSSAEDSEKSWARAGASGLNWFTPPGYAVVAGGGSRIPRSGPSGGAVVAQALLDVRGVLVHVLLARQLLDAPDHLISGLTHHHGLLLALQLEVLESDRLPHHHVD